MRSLHTDNVLHTLNGSPGPVTLQKVLSHLVSIALSGNILFSYWFLQVNSSRSARAAAPLPPPLPTNPLMMTNHLLYLAGKRKRCPAIHQRPSWFLRYVRQVPHLCVPMPKHPRKSKFLTSPSFIKFLKRFQKSKSSVGGWKHHWRFGGLKCVKMWFII